MRESEAPRAVDGRQIGVYFGLLALAVGLGSPGGHGAPSGLANLPIKFFLKDQLGLEAEAVAGFWALISLPLYFGCLFGLLRDRWRPRLLGDRAYLFLAAPLVAGCYLWLAAGRVDTPRLLAAILLAVCGYQLLNSATAGLMTAVAQRQRMTGRLGALAQLAAALPAVFASLAGGWLAASVSARATFLLAALLPLAILAQAFWRPRAVFGEQAPVGGRREAGSNSNSNSSSNSEVQGKGDGAWDGGAGGSTREAVRRLLAHRPLWPAAAICLLWDFAPGGGTALFYHLTDGIGLKGAQMGVVDGTSAACTAAGAIAYGCFCHRLPLRRLLQWSLGLGILCGPLYVLIGNAWQAVAISVAVGLLQGFTNAGFRGDLLMRSCPHGLEGTGRMLGVSASAIAVSAGDLLGAWLYARGGFGLCLAITTLATCLILPLLWAVPQSITAAAEAEGSKTKVTPAEPLLAPGAAA